MRATAESGAVAGHLQFGHHPDSAVARISNHIADFLLRVIRSAGTHFVQFGKFPALEAEPLVVGKVPVKNVHFHSFHAVQVAANDFDGCEVARRVDQETTPGETRSVINCYSGRPEAFARNVDELQESL